MTFGLFDESGDGALDEEELEKLLRTFGQEPTKEKVFIKNRSHLAPRSQQRRTKAHNSTHASACI